MTLFGPATDAYGIRDLYRRASVAIARTFRGEVWVRAEISTLREQNGWCFLTLTEPARDAAERDASLEVVIWQSAWTRIGNSLSRRGLNLREGMTVSLRGEVALRPGTGRLQLRCSALDTDALLGEVTARRRALREALAAEGLLDANRRRPLGAVPLRVGLVASPQSQGYQDFRGVLATSGYAFVLTEKAVVVQGPGAPGAVAAALQALAEAEVDVIVIVRGGGARGDLDAFDSEQVARAVASSPLPVWTGVGHTGDRSLADDAAAVSHSTPTACAQALVSTVADFDRSIARRVRKVQELVRGATVGADGRLQRCRHLLARATTAQLDRSADGIVRRGADVRRGAEHALAVSAAATRATASRLPLLAASRIGVGADSLRGRASDLGRAAGDGLDRRAGELEEAGARAGGAARRAVSDVEREVAATRRVLRAYDPTRQLERGWTLTFDHDGALVRSAVALRAGSRITSRFVDGDRTSIVEPATTLS